MRKLLVILLLMPFLAACEQIDTGHRGVKTVFGEVDEKLGSLPEGLYFYNIFTSSISELDTRTQVMKGKTNTYTRDVQQADITFVANFSLERTHAHTVFKDVGKVWAEKLVPQAIEGVLKQVIGTYDAVDLISQRAKASADAYKQIADSLKPYHVVLERFEMVNISYLKEFEKAVENKMVAVQKAIEEKNRTEQTKEQAKQLVINAQAAAESMRIRANALTQNAKLVEYEAVQKWDGKLPVYNFGGGSLPFVNVPMHK